jgi:hypothetical protein
LPYPLGLELIGFQQALEHLDFASIRLLEPQFIESLEQWLAHLAASCCLFTIERLTKISQLAEQH